MKVKLRSRILEYFPVDLIIRLNEITYEDATNKVKGEMIQQELRNAGIDFLPLGSGTNRLGIQIGEYVYKIALDNHGKIDNRREMYYAPNLSSYVIKCYDCLPDGLIMVCEALTPMSEAEFQMSKDEILKILKTISDTFFIGDIGFTGQNYGNWGIRKTDKKLCILDFAYVYSITYQKFQCTCKDSAFLQYDDNFVNLICPACGRKWTFGEIRKRISKQDEAAEIADLEKKNYILHGAVEEVEAHPEYTPIISKSKEEKKLSKFKAMQKRNREIIRKMEEAESYDFNEESEFRTIYDYFDTFKESN